MGRKKKKGWRGKLTKHRDTMVTVLPLSLHKNKISLMKDRNTTNSGADQGLRDSHVQAPGKNKGQEMKKYFLLQPQGKGHGGARAGHHGAFTLTSMQVRTPSKKDRCHSLGFLPTEYHIVWEYVLVLFTDFLLLVSPHRL